MNYFLTDILPEIKRIISYTEKEIIVEPKAPNAADEPQLKELSSYTVITDSHILEKNMNKLFSHAYFFLSKVK